MGLVSRQWDAVDLACVLCDRRIHKSPHFQRRFQLWEKREVAWRQIWAGGGAVRPGRCNVLRLPPKTSPNANSSLGRRIDADSLICSLGHCECDCHSVHKLSQQRLTADWLAPRESDCSWMCSKVSSDWLPSYIKATRPVLGIFKMIGNFTDRPRT
jgi:hypothetical protein